ncbi:MAG: DUF2911 domain-containing protein, partial [Bacteroidetes bacterium]
MIQKNVFPLFALCTVLSSLLMQQLYGQQAITTPPSGMNMRSQVQQQVGLATVSLNYNSPNVDGRDGKIWGELVPYGTVNFKEEGFGTSTQGPWRAGANENTVISFSHDVRVQGKDLRAGSYGFHVIPQQDKPWILIFSRNSTAWGSYFYDPAQDALRVEASPEVAEFSEFLTYEFRERLLDKTVLALHWEKLRLPFTIEVPGMMQLYVDQMRRELQNTQGFNWAGYQSAADFCVQNNINLEEALTWADMAISAPFIGEENYATLQTKASVLNALGRSAEADAVQKRALDIATPLQAYNIGSGLIQAGKNEKAMEVFQFLAKKFPNEWTSAAGLAAGYR